MTGQLVIKGPSTKVRRDRTGTIKPGFLGVGTSTTPEKLEGVQTVDEDQGTPGRQLGGDSVKTHILFSFSEVFSCKESVRRFRE